MVIQDQRSLLREELLRDVLGLPGPDDFRAMVAEPLSKYGRGLSEDSGDNRAWPILPLMVAEAVSGYPDHLVPVASCLQYCMAAGDVLDDIEDADSSDSLAARYGNAVANNVATALIAMAEVALIKLKPELIGQDNVLRIIELVNRQYLKACIGQHLDITHSSDIFMTEDRYLEIATMKSSSQVECACRAGAIGGQAGTELCDIFGEFGSNLGMAAQLTNDIAGIINGGDIKNRKISVPVLYALKNTGNDERARIINYYKGRDTSPMVPSIIRELLFSRGAVHYTTSLMELYKFTAAEHLHKAKTLGADIRPFQVFLA